MTDSASVDDKQRRGSVFVVYGRNTAARVAIAGFLRSIGLNPIEWSQAIAMTGEPTPYIGKILDVALDTAQAIVVLLSPDEIACLRPEYADGGNDPETRPSGQPRPNVLFEAGLALGRAPQRTILIEFGSIRQFSDIAGLHMVRAGNSLASRQAIASRLKVAGCTVDLSGTDWHEAGDFTPPPSLDREPVGRPPSAEPGPGGVPAGCRGWIDSPGDTDTVGTRFAVRGGVRGMPPMLHAWIAHRVDPGGLYWPKEPEITLDRKGDFVVYVNEEGVSPRVYVTLLLVTPALNDEINHWIHDAGRTGNYRGLRLSPGSYAELASVCVRREISGGT